MNETYKVVYYMHKRYHMSCTYNIERPFRTYDIVYDMFRSRPTMSYVPDTMPYVDVQNRVNVQYSTYDVVRLYSDVHRAYDIVRAI